MRFADDFFELYCSPIMDFSGPPAADRFPARSEAKGLPSLDVASSNLLPLLLLLLPLLFLLPPLLLFLLPLLLLFFPPAVLPEANLGCKS